MQSTPDDLYRRAQALRAESPRPLTATLLMRHLHIPWNQAVRLLERLSEEEVPFRSSLGL